MKPVPEGVEHGLGFVQLPPPCPAGPHCQILPSCLRAAKPQAFEVMVVNPVPVGAPLPPYDGSPHATMLPSCLSAAKALVAE